MSEDRSSKFVIALGVFVCLFILSGCSPKVIPPIWEKKCTFDDYYRASEPLGSDYMDSIERTISGDLNFEDFPAELVIAERLKNSVDNVLEHPDGIEVFCQVNIEVVVLSIVEISGDVDEILRGVVSLLYQKGHVTFDVFYNS